MQRAVMNGETETGVTVMYMDEGMDTGDIITTATFPIGPSDTFETVHDTSARLGAELLPAVIATIENGTVQRTPQNHAEATYAPKIEKEECEIDWSKSAEVLDPYLRGLTPIPLPYTYLQNGKMLKVCSAHPVKGAGEPGTVLSLSDKGEGAIVVACGEGALAITSLRPEGKGNMSAAAFIRGRGIAVGDKLGKA
jgi:methionyl-tRNA formyltransferase